MKDTFTSRIIIAALLMLLPAACTRSLSNSDGGWIPVPIEKVPTATPEKIHQPPALTATTGQFGLFFPTSNANAVVYTPTPDVPHTMPVIREHPETYIVQRGDTLGQIALRFNVPPEAIIKANHIANPNILEIGIQLEIPAPKPGSTGSGYKIIPDSELVASPAAIIFDADGFIAAQNGYLAHYEEGFEKRNLTGTKIVKEIARDYSVNPRILLAILEYQSGWVSQAKPKSKYITYPLGWSDPTKKGLYKQLSWAANELNRGYYLWKANAVSSWLLPDGTMVPVDPTINSGTAGIQHLLALLHNRKQWNQAVSPQGFAETYRRMFGNPFAYTYEPILPAGLKQPAMQLPFEEGVDWSFTGGPHGGWGTGSAWAALDFAPPSPILGCYESPEWVVAVSDGLIVRSAHGAVVQDLDGDGFEQTGWSVLYLHIATNDRVKSGTYLKAGERIGHPSCEGGFSTGTHLHLARRYNGEWIPADRSIPFNLDGWISSGTGIRYDGILTRGKKTIEAWNGRAEINTIHR